MNHDEENSLIKQFLRHMKLTQVAQEIGVHEKTVRHFVYGAPISDKTRDALHAYIAEYGGIVETLIEYHRLDLANRNVVPATITVKGREYALISTPTKSDDILAQFDDVDENGVVIKQGTTGSTLKIETPVAKPTPQPRMNPMPNAFTEFAWDYMGEATQRWWHMLSDEERSKVSNELRNGRPLSGRISDEVGRILDKTKDMDMGYYDWSKHNGI